MILSIQRVIGLFVVEPTVSMTWRKVTLSTYEVKGAYLICKTTYGDRWLVYHIRTQLHHQTSKFGQFLFVFATRLQLKKLFPCFATGCKKTYGDRWHVYRIHTQLRHQTIKFGRFLFVFATRLQLRKFFSCFATGC